MYKYIERCRNSEISIGRLINGHWLRQQMKDLRELKSLLALIIKIIYLPDWTNTADARPLRRSM